MVLSDFTGSLTRLGALCHPDFRPRLCKAETSLEPKSNPRLFLANSLLVPTWHRSLCVPRVVIVTGSREPGYGTDRKMVMTWAPKGTISRSSSDLIEMGRMDHKAVHLQYITRIDFDLINGQVGAKARLQRSHEQVLKHLD